mgnify:CR=1 FL=1
MDNQKSITIRAFLIGMIVTVIFAIMTVYLNNVYNSHISATQIPLLPYVFLFIMVLVVNPLCRLIRVIRPFNQGELLTMNPHQLHASDAVFLVATLAVIFMVQLVGRI